MIEDRLMRFFESFHSIYKDNYRRLAEILLRAYEGDVRGLSATDRMLVNDLLEVIRELRIARSSTLHEMRDFILRSSPGYDYVYVVDALGLPELYGLWCEAGKVKLIPILKLFVNSEANTRAFKEVFGCEDLACVAGASQGMVLKKMDVLIHDIMSGESRSRYEIIDLIVARVKHVTLELPLVKGNTMILSDHGYDIVRVNSRYIATHTHGHRTPLALAKIAPVILLKRIH